MALSISPRYRRVGQETLATQLAITQERYRTFFKTLPQGVIYYAADGRVLEANPAASEILGVDLAAMRAWPLVVPGQAVREDGVPFRPEEFPVRVALRTGEVITDVVMGVPHGRTALASAMGQAVGLAAEQACAAVQTAMLGTAPRTDDVCLLAARIAG